MGIYMGVHIYICVYMNACFNYLNVGVCILLYMYVFVKICVRVRVYVLGYARVLVHTCVC